MANRPSDALPRNCSLLLHDVARLLRTRFEQQARGVLGLTRAQWSALIHLKHNDGINLSSLAETMDVEPITLARVVDKLEAMGLVERRAHATDRRVRTLHMLRLADPVLEKMQRVGKTVRDEAFAGLSSADVDRLVDTLIAVKRNLTESDRPESGASAPQHAHEKLKVSHG